MATQSLWRRTGGFPTESAVGASDAALISIIMTHPEAGQLHQVARYPVYNYRPHDESDTAERGPWQGAILEVRRQAAIHWKKPEWGRYGV